MQRSSTRKYYPSCRAHSSTSVPSCGGAPCCIHPRLPAPIPMPIVSAEWQLSLPDHTSYYITAPNQYLLSLTVGGGVWLPGLRTLWILYRLYLLVIAILVSGIRSENIGLCKIAHFYMFYARFLLLLCTIIIC